MSDEQRPESEATPYQQAVGRSVAAFAGALSAMHSNLGEIQVQVNDEDANDLDNARVYLEAAFWKLETVLARQGPVIRPGVQKP